MLMTEAEKHGFEHYEISNFGLPGFYSRHNCAYWKDVPYIGIGPSAHSYDGSSRQWNIASNAAYLLAIRKGELAAETEQLSMENRYNEYIMTGLRTRWGVDLEKIEQNFGVTFQSDFLVQIAPYIETGMVMTEGSIVSLTSKGKLLADRITAAVFVA
jgi:oxygen-independent coproporphyrinogen-3 oxidase